MEPNRGRGTLYADPLLTNISVLYMQERKNFIGATVFPVVQSDLQSGLYNIYPKGYFMRTEMAARPLGGKPREAGYKVESSSFICEEYALEKPIDDRQRINSRDALGPDRGATIFLSSNAIIHWETKWAKNYFKPGVWTLETQGVASGPTGTQFLKWTQAGSSPLKDMRKWKRQMQLATGMMPNKMVLGASAYDTLAEHPEVIERIKYTQTGILTPDLLAAMFELDEVMVAGGVQMTSGEGVTPETTAFIANANAGLLVHAPDTASVETPSAGYTFLWNGLLPGQVNELGGVIERIRDDRARSDVLSIRQAWDQRRVAGDLGYYLQDIV